MNKKELRKELELSLIKVIEETLNKKNPEAGKEIKKATHQASKSVAKKFYKAIKGLADKRTFLKATRTEDAKKKAKPSVKRKAVKQKASPKTAARSGKK